MRRGWLRMFENQKKRKITWKHILAGAAILFVIGKLVGGKEEAKQVATEIPPPKQTTTVQQQTTTASLGDPLENFDKVYGKGKDGAAVRYKEDYVLVMPMDNKAYNITIQFSATDKKRRTKDESLTVVKDFIPSDANKVKEWHVEQGKDVIQFESKSLANKFDKTIFGNNPVGTFIVIVKSDDQGIFSLITAPGNNP
ncbi:MAG: hypothetical protein K0Q73_6281 [Paenibacillus sp.]|jgi:hypothetical protein|nr:hypothetical protein [Paenibacillus sp.]